MAKSKLPPGITAKHVSKLLNDWKARPHNYLLDHLGIEKIWKLQEKLLDVCPVAIREHKQIYIASGHSLGKDYISAGIALWFLHCFKDAIVIETAPTKRQVDKVMWGETLRHWNNRKFDLGGKAYKSPLIEIVPENWYLIGFTTKESGASKQASGGKFQGFHSNSVCVIVSEAQAVDDEIFDQVDAVTTAENNLVIYLGNPTRASGRFAKGLRDKTNNIVFNFSCLDNPNYRHKETIIPGLCSYQWVEDKRRKWGETDPRWQGRVLGQIPDVSINDIFPQSLIDIGLKVTDTHGLRHNNGVAIDVSGEGDDDNVIMGGMRGIVKDMIVKPISPPSENAVNCVKMCEEQDGIFVVVDCDGMGIKEWQELNKIPGINEKYHLVKFHGSSRLPTDRAKNPGGYENIRAKASFTAQERLKSGLASIPDDDELVEELLEFKFFENKRGLIQVEDNDDIKERLGRSPDKAMAWIMLQYGFSLELDPIDLKKKHDPYGNDIDYEDYPYNPATV